MPTPTLVNLSSLIDDAKCYELVRQHRWPEGARCPGCGGASVARHGRDDTQPHRQRYRCTACGARFDDLTGTVLAGHHQPLRVWVLCLYFMGLNLSNRQIAQELGLSQPDVQLMTEQLRPGLVARIPPVRLGGEVERPWCTDQQDGRTGPHPPFGFTRCGRTPGGRARACGSGHGRPW